MTCISNAFHGNQLQKQDIFLRFFPTREEQYITGDTKICDYYKIVHVIHLQKQSEGRWREQATLNTCMAPNKLYFIIYQSYNK